MNYATLISPTDFRDYAKVRGWIPVPDAIPERLYVLNNPALKFHQIIVPMDMDRPDYDDAVRVAIEQLAEAEQRSFGLVEASLMEAGADTLRFGVSSMRQLEGGLPLSYAVKGVKGVENALRAAACSEVQRQRFHPKMNRVEAQKLIEAAQMRHTESGSFVLKVACPLDAVPSDTGDLLQAPFVRRAMLGMNQAMRDLVNALEADTLNTLVEEAKKDGVSPLSSNLCEGLIAFQDEDLRANLDVSVSWSARLESPPPIYRDKVRIQWDYFPRIEQVRVALRPEEKVMEQPFVGMVDELKGELGPGEQREGEVILNLFVEGESIKAKANLTVDHHRIAHQAYGQGKTYIKVTGVLQPGNQPRKLTDVKEFILLDK